MMPDAIDDLNLQPKDDSSSRADPPTRRTRSPIGGFLDVTILRPPSFLVLPYTACFMASLRSDTMEASSPEAPNELAQLLEQVIALPLETHTLVLRHLPMPELARLSCVHKALLVAWQELRRKHPGKRYDPPTPGDLASVKDYPRLVRAGYFGDVAVIQAMMAAGVDEHGVPLLEAHTADDDDIVRYGRVRAVDAALCNAASFGHLHAAELLLDAGADVNAFVLLGMDSDKMPFRPLHCASYSGHADIVQLLIQRGANVRAYGDHALQLASLHGHADVVQLLIQHGAVMPPEEEDRDYGDY
jgi:hypothetical protein